VSGRYAVAGAARPRRVVKALRSRTEIEPLLPKIRQAIEELYGDRLVKVILYGSFARGKATEDSDIDIAVVLKGEVNKMLEIDRIHEVIYNLTLQAGELVSVSPMSECELAESEWPLYYWIRKEGVQL
jgi:predicted nucleotidyltransferase